MLIQSQCCTSLRQAWVWNFVHLDNVSRTHSFVNVQTHQKWHSVAPT
jgi:hypothetical protein